MIWISFNRWMLANNILFQAERRYWGRRWTPFCKVKFAYRPILSRVRNNTFKESLRWCVVGEAPKIRLFRQKRFKTVEEVQTYIEDILNV